MLTRGGVCYDLVKTPFESTQRYTNQGEMVFKFSSEYNLNNFNNKFKENREKINTSLSKRFNLNINCDLLADIKLYEKIEKRGFLIVGESESIECLNNTTLDGMITTTRN